MNLSGKGKKFWFIAISVCLLAIVAWYITIPALVLWWFYKKSKFSNKTKKIATGGVICIFLLLSIWGFVAYSKDIEPHLSVTQPPSDTTVRSSEINIKGTYEPADRKVWVNGNKIEAANGNFETTYKLKEGENIIEVAAGDWKRAKTTIKVIRELTDEEKTAKTAVNSSETDNSNNKEAQKSFVDTELSEESVKREIDKLSGGRSMQGKSISKIQILDNAGTTDIQDDKIVWITYKPEAVWDEKDIVKMTVDTTITSSEKLFQHPKVGVVRVWSQTEFTDQYGKKDVNNAVKIELHKTTAEKIDWQNFKPMVFVDYQKLLNIADDIWIHPSIKNKL